jgi:RIO kinase 1
MIEENNLVSLNQYDLSQSSLSQSNQSQPDPSMFDYEPDPLEVYAAIYDPDFELGETVRMPRNPKAKASNKESVAELTDMAEGLEAGFEITYKPARFEAVWLLDSLRTFYDQALITDVVAQVKGGKEASVYRCVAHPSTGVDYLAAKVYRPRMFRNLRNDKMYREGRRILGPDGKTPKERDVRLQRALDKGTAFGAQMSHTSWLMHEFTTLDKLYRAGAMVPKPYAAGENAILMSYIGDDQLPAPILRSVDLTEVEALTLFDDVMSNVELLLKHDLVHGDLSAFNILYWDGAIMLIDFPQVVESKQNPHAYKIFQRDVQRVCEYFVDQGVACDARSIVKEMWDRYAAVEPLDELADLSRWAEENEER